MPLTLLRADLHWISTYSTPVRRGSGASTLPIIEQTFALVLRGRVGGKRYVRSGPTRRLRPCGGRRAEVVEDALLAPRPPRDAYPPPMQDQPQRQPRPLLLRHHRAHLALDLGRVSRRHELDQVGQTDHMRVDREPGHVEPDAEDHVRRLAA